MSDFERALEQSRKESVTRLLEILRATPFPPGGVESPVFAIMIRQFLACGIDTIEFATAMGVTANTIYGWTRDNPPKSFAQKSVADWIKQYLLDQHMTA